MRRDDAAFFPDTATPPPAPEPEPQPAGLSSALTLDQLAGMVAAYFTRLSATVTFERGEALTLTQGFQAAVVASLAIGAQDGNNDSNEPA